MSGTSSGSKVVITITGAYYFAPCAVDWNVRALYLYCLRSGACEVNWWTRLWNNGRYQLEMSRRRFVAGLVEDLINASRH